MLLATTQQYLTLQNAESIFHDIKLYVEKVLEITLPIHLLDPMHDYGRKPHQLELWWESFKLGLHTAQQKNNIAWMGGRFELAALYFQILKVKHLQGFSDIEGRLSNQEEFLGAVFEIAVLSWYIKKYPDIEICNPDRGDVENGREFRIVRENKAVYIEAKSLNYDPRKSDFAAKKICKSIVSESEEACVPCIFKIIPKKPLDEISLINIKSSIRSILSDSFTDFTERSLPEYDIYVRKLWKFNQCIPESDFHDLSNKLREITYQYAKVETCNGQVKNIYISCVYEYRREDIGKYLVSRLQEARKQIPSSGPGIIYVNIPYGSEAQLSDVDRRVHDSAFKWLKSNTKRVNAVVLISNMITDKPEAHSVEFNYARAVIPNFNSRAKFPEWFSMLEASEAELKFEIVENLNLSFNWTPKSDDDTPRIDYCTRDALQQIRLLKGVNNTWFFTLISKDENINIRETIARPRIVAGTTYNFLLFVDKREVYFLLDNEKLVHRTYEKFILKK